jgi:hypothetical protein
VACLTTGQAAASEARKEGLPRKREQRRLWGASKTGSDEQRAESARNERIGSVCRGLNFSDPFGLCPGVPNTNQLDISDCPPGYFTVLGAALGGTGGGAAGAVAGAAGCSPGGPVLVACSLAGAAAGGKAGMAAGAFVGSALDAGVGIARMANAGKGRGGNRVPNEQIQELYRKYGLNKQGESWVHRRISRRNMDIDEIEDAVREAADHSKFLKNPPPNQ